jgi:hypothetical protein
MLEIKRSIYTAYFILFAEISAFGVTGIQKLKGEWEFYWEEFLYSEDFLDAEFEIGTFDTDPGRAYKI